MLSPWWEQGDVTQRPPVVTPFSRVIISSLSRFTTYPIPGRSKWSIILPRQQEVFQGFFLRGLNVGIENLKPSNQFPYPKLPNFSIRAEHQERGQCVHQRGRQIAYITSNKHWDAWPPYLYQGWVETRSFTKTHHNLCWYFSQATTEQILWFLK